MDDGELGDGDVNMEPSEGESGDEVDRKLEKRLNKIMSKFRVMKSEEVEDLVKENKSG
jgi:hypothetical protein